MSQIKKKGEEEKGQLHPENTGLDASCISFLRFLRINGFMTQKHGES